MAFAGETFIPEQWAAVVFLPAIFSAVYIVLVCFGLYRRAQEKRPLVRLPSALLQLYNAFQVLLSLLTVWLAVLAAFGAGPDDLFPVARSSTRLRLALNPPALWWRNAWVQSAIQLHYFSKFVDMFDTLIIVMHAKWDQLSFLHVYHHLTILWCWSAVLYLYKDPDGLLGAWGNSVVHAVMYSYYFTTALGIKVPSSLKKNLTSLQMIQFLLISVQSLYIVFNSPRRHARYPVWFQASSVQLFEMLSLFLLFALWRKKRYRTIPYNPTSPLSPLLKSA